MAATYVDFFVQLAKALGGVAALLVAIAIVVIVFKKILNMLPSLLAKAVVLLLKLGVVATMIWFLLEPDAFGFSAELFDDLSVERMQEVLADLNLGSAAPWLAFAAVAKLLGIFAGVIRWRILLRGQGVHIPFWYLTKCWFWGRAVGLFLPGTLGLDGYRLVESSRYTGEAIKCTTVIAVEKLTGIIALFGLVFLTLPLGFSLFGDAINVTVLGIVLGVLAVFIGVSIILLIQPRVIQILAAVVPLPGKIKNVINNLGLSVTAYGSNRASLFVALFFGLCVHLGMVFMYVGTLKAIAGASANIVDVVFAAPLIIVGSVFAPTVSGMGVREVVMTTALGGTYGANESFLIGHLGLWFGEIVPFLLSLPLLLFTTRPNRDDLMDDIETVRAEAAKKDRSVHLADWEVDEYRNRVFGTIICGLFGGLFAGGIIGLAEAGYLWNNFSEGYAEAGSFWWGPAAYGLIFACVGIGISGGLLFLYLLFNKFARGIYTYALATAGSLAAGALVIGMFRYGRDFLGEAAMGSQDYLRVAMFAAGIGLVGLVGSFLVAQITGLLFRRSGYAMLIPGIATYLLCVVGGFVASQQLQPPPSTPDFAAPRPAEGPNVFLVAIDTLRADYLQLFNPEAEAETPKLAEFAQDGIVYTRAFSQASWTKASFGTIFSGMYPECHTSTSKISSLPDGVDTVAEVLRDGGYYTQGYSNNPNIASVFGYDQGHVEYVDLKPDYLFGATKSASDLSMYNVLRAIRGQLVKRLPNVITTPSSITAFRQTVELPPVEIPFHVWKPKIKVTDFYQPANVVTDTALSWLDSGRVPEGTPTYLFTHYMDPHDPFMAPDSYAGGYARVALGTDIDPEVYREPMREAYINEIEYLDTELGRFFDGLKERGLYEDALIILTADHGEEFCDHGGWWHGLTLYDEQIHIPMIVKLPGNANSGRRNINMARNLDLAPTILQFAGLEPSPLMQGQPLFDENLRDTNASIDYSYAENDFEGIVLQAVRDKNDFKLIEANEGNKRNLAPIELYELREDPGEQNNLASDPQFSTIEENLLNVIDQYLQICEEGTVEPSADTSDAEELQEQLESLGYL